MLLSYDKVCRDSDANAPCGAVAGVAQGSGFAALDPQTGSVTRLARGTVTRLEGKDSRLTFGPDKRIRWMWFEVDRRTGTAVAPRIRADP